MDLPYQKGIFEDFCLWNYYLAASEIKPSTTRIEAMGQMLGPLLEGTRALKLHLQTLFIINIILQRTKMKIKEVG